MNKKMIFVLTVMAIISIGLLSWMGITGMQLESERREQQLQYLGNQQLEIVRDNINKVFIDLENELISILDFTGADIDKIRLTQRNNNLIKQIFITDKEGLVFPNKDIPLSEREESFITRIKETDISFNFLQKSNNENLEGSLQEGWHTWFMGDGLNFIYWQKNKNTDTEDYIAGLELNRSAVLSEIINSLPLTFEDNSSIRITVSNISGSILYQWGGYSPEDKTSANASLSLNNLLSSWNLEYYIDPVAVNTSANSLILLVSLLTVLLVIIALSVYLYRESTREIREASQKVSFVNQVSHELKTPLTNIRMYAELLETKLKIEDKKSKKHLGIIISESNRLSRLINNVLSFAKDKKNGVEFNPVMISPDEVILRTIDSFRYSLKTKKINVQTKLNASKDMMIDTDIVEQILSNLISNVEKYASNGEWIKIDSSILGNEIIINVSDRGSGVYKDLVDRIFEPFYRVSNKLTDGVSGTGIGLSLVKKLTEIHGGSVSLISSNTDIDFKGSVFQVILNSPREEA